MPSTQANETRRTIRLTAWNRETNQFVEKRVTLHRPLPDRVSKAKSSVLLAMAGTLLDNATEYGWEVVE